MKEWLRNIIRSNLPELIASTTNLDKILCDLQVYDVLDFEEVEGVEKTRRTKGRNEATQQMYNIAMGKPNGFEGMLWSLFNNNQKAAYMRLVQDVETLLGYSEIEYDDLCENSDYRFFSALNVLENLPKDISDNLDGKKQPSKARELRAISVPPPTQALSPSKIAHQQQKQSFSNSKKHQSSDPSGPFVKKDHGIVEEKIKFTPSKEHELGTGSGGTRVYKGTNGKRNIAVKQLTDFKNVEEAKREIEMLSGLDGHENVIRYYGWEARTDSILLAIELAKATLETWVYHKNCIAPSAVSEKTILKQTTAGLQFLHYKKLIHRDLKPSNILLVVLSPDKVLAKISDFGISRLLVQGRTSKTITSVVGTEGWMAPEILKFIDESRKKRKEKKPELDEKTTMTNKTDIFSLGCVFYFVLSNGDHPFGEVDTEYNIKQGMDVVSQRTDILDVASNQNILRTLISQNPKARPTAGEILADPVFWPYHKLLQFLVDISDFVEDVMLENFKSPSKQDQNIKQESLFKKKEDCIGKLEAAYYHKICVNKTDGWFPHACPILQNHLMNDRYTKQSLKSVLGLIRVIRNLRNHNGQLDKKVRIALGGLPNGYMQYWLKRFPLLVFHTRGAFDCLRSEEKLSSYY